MAVNSKEMMIKDYSTKKPIWKVICQVPFLPFLLPLPSKNTRNIDFFFFDFSFIYLFVIFSLFVYFLLLLKIYIHQKQENDKKSTQDIFKLEVIWKKIEALFSFYSLTLSHAQVFLILYVSLYLYQYIYLYIYDFISTIHIDLLNHIIYLIFHRNNINHQD